jgi:hypothetical protein
MRLHRARYLYAGFAAIFGTLAATSVGTLAATSAVFAEASTSRGRISVAQVRAMLDQAATNPIARQTLTAYLAGTGETAGWLVAAAAGQGSPLQSCARPLSLDDNAARQAIEGRAANASVAAETDATPLIVRDMLKRAGCRLIDR